MSTPVENEMTEPDPIDGEAEVGAPNSDAAPLSRDAGDEVSHRAANHPDAPAGFLARWSRRKRAEADQRPSLDEADESGSASAAPETQSGAIAPVADAAQASPPPLTDADMPDIESLDAQSDVSGFLSPEVSEELRRAALRKVFLSPAFNVVDGLDDYDEDFTRFEGLGDMVTSHMQHQAEVAEEQAKARLRQAEADRAADGDSEPLESSDSPDVNESSDASQELAATPERRPHAVEQHAKLEAEAGGEWHQSDDVAADAVRASDITIPVAQVQLNSARDNWSDAETEHPPATSDDSDAASVS